MTRGVAREEGWIDEQLAAEHPGVGLLWTEVAARPGRTPRPVRRQMRELASRYTGAKVIQSRQDEVPWAYRVLWRRLGVDPDSDRTPIERLMLERLELGGIPSHGMPEDAAVVATLETGVPVTVFDAAAVDGRLGLRLALAGERLGDGDGARLRAGEVVYADEQRPIARLTGEVAASHEPGPQTTTMLVCVLAAATVSQIALDEALWTASNLLQAAGRLDESSEEEPA
jgi:DNA/RNA-binding domain of Phe-tRNA-synthetase-like protein